MTIESGRVGSVFATFDDRTLWATSELKQIGWYVSMYVVVPTVLIPFISERQYILNNAHQRIFAHTCEENWI